MFTSCVKYIVTSGVILKTGLDNYDRSKNQDRRNDVRALPRHRLQKRFSSVVGVSAAKVNLGDKEATVTYDSKKTNVDAIKAAIVKADIKLRQIMNPNL